MKIAALFLWLAVPLGAYGVYVTYGTPHLIWSYEFRANGARYDLRVPRDYITCTYVGWGPRTLTVPAVSARCPWVRLFHGEDRM